MGAAKNWVNRRVNCKRLDKLESLEPVV